MGEKGERNMIELRKTMKVLVFGATGTTGREVVKQALDLGYQVSAFVRDPAKVALEHKNLTVLHYKKNPTIMQDNLKHV